jgi:hypothetical protein
MYNWDGLIFPITYSKVFKYFVELDNPADDEVAGDFQWRPLPKKPEVKE